MAFILVYFQVVSLLATPQALPYHHRAVAADADLDSKSKDAASLIMNIPGVQGNSQFSYTEIPIDHPSQLTEVLQREETRNADVLLSTDTPEVFESVAEAVQKTEKSSDRMFRFLPIGKMASVKEKLASGWADYKTNVANTVKYDKLGLSIVIITTSYDSFIWIHSASLDVYQKSAMVMMNVIFAAAFALDRDMWTKMTVPLRHRIMKTLDKLSNKTSNAQEQNAELQKNTVDLKTAKMVEEHKAALYARKVLASQFLANLTFSVGFQILRGSIMSFHDLAANVMTSGFWATSIKIAAITTLATFAWSELTAAADVEKNPVAKNALKRIADVRNIVMSRLASMGMVLQPGAYGISPIVAIVTSGAIGLLALVKSNEVIQWLENNRAANVLFKYQRKLETLVNETGARLRDAVATKLQAAKSYGGAGSCVQLFN